MKEALEEELMPKYKDFAANLRPILNISEDQPIKFRAITELKSIQMEVSLSNVFGLIYGSLKRFSTI
jgi:hypothetical protein